MNRDRRDVLTIEDLEQALRDSNHDLVITPCAHYQPTEEGAPREDKLYTSPSSIMEEQLRLLGNRQLEGPRMSGRWIYLKGKVPSTSENVNIKKL